MDCCCRRWRNQSQAAFRPHNFKPDLPVVELDDGRQTGKLSLDRYKPTPQKPLAVVANRYYTTQISASFKGIPI